jgi:predicted NBD/HSP70 family sugar kinase
VGLDTPGPASANGVLSSKGGTNFSAVEWHGFDVRQALEDELDLPVIYNNDGNAAALYAHHVHFGLLSTERSSVSAIVGTGLGGGVIESGRIVKGATGMAGELGHVHIPVHGLLADGQPMPRCNCGFEGDAESIASLSGIRNNLLPYWLTQYPDHPLHDVDVYEGAKLVRGYGEGGDEMARKIFEQQAIALGRLFTIAANFTDPDVYFIGGGVIEAEPDFRDWFLERVRAHWPTSTWPGRGARRSPRWPCWPTRRSNTGPGTLLPREPGIGGHTDRKVTLMRGPVTRATLGTLCSQSCWQAPPITSRSPLPASHDSDDPPPRGRRRNGRGAPRLTIATTGLVTW